MTRLRQRTPRACGATALAIFVTELVVRHVDPEMHGLDGLYNKDIVDAAKRLGVTLLPLRHSERNPKFDLDVDEGILGLRWTDKARKAANPRGHYVAVIGGLIHCPDEHVVMPHRQYLLTYRAVPCSLLKVVRPDAS